MIILNPTFIATLASLPENRVFGLDGQTFVQVAVHALSFFVAATVVILLLYGPVRDYMDRRKVAVKAQRDQAASDMARALAIKADYEQKLKSIEFERTAIMDEARKIAGEERSKLLAAAKVEADGIKTRTFREIAAARDLIKNDTHHAVVEIASDIAAKFLAAPVEKDAFHTVFAEAMETLESTAFKAS
jgi:F-type H+-transporting ATPase subunit b